MPWVFLVRIMKTSLKGECGFVDDQELIVELHIVLELAQKLVEARVGPRFCDGIKDYVLLAI